MIQIPNPYEDEGIGAFEILVLALLSIIAVGVYDGTFGVVGFAASIVLVIIGFIGVGICVEWLEDKWSNRGGSIGE